MSILTQAPLAPLLERLFAASDTAPEPAAFSMPEAELHRLMRSKTDYLEFYGALKDVALPVSRETGALLYVLARNGKAKNIVEFGTSFGISTLHLAAALRENGGGKIITTEFEASKAAKARAHFMEGGVADLVEIREGDALQTLRRDLPAQIDLLVLDGAKSLYPEILALVQSRLQPGALIVADNADYAPDYLEIVRGGGNYLSIPFGEDVEVSMRL